MSCESRVVEVQCDCPDGPCGWQHLDYVHEGREQKQPSRDRQRRGPGHDRQITSPRSDR